MARSMLAALLVVAIGISASPNFDGAVALGLAGLISIVAAGLTAVQAYVPFLSLQSYIPGIAGKMADAFVRAGLGAFLVSVLGWLAMPDLSTWKSLLIASIVGGINAGLRAIQGAADPNEGPFRGVGIPAPPPPPTAA